MNLSQIRQDADRHLQDNAGSFSKLVLIHTAITACMSLLLMLVTSLSSHISLEGGLSNMNAQNLLSTGQVLLQLLITIATPFWEAGLIFCALKLLQNGQCATNNLTEGFRRWGPIASSLIIRGLIYFGVSIACYFVCSIVISLIPLSPSVIEDLTAFVTAPTFPLSSGVRSYLIVCSLLYIATLCILLVPRLYLHRLVVYRVMDNKPCGGLPAVLYSRILMKGHRRELFLLDLSFWWFYLLEVGIVILSMGYAILPVLGIPLPINAEVASWVFTIIALLCQLALYRSVKPKIIVSYALFYRNIYDEGLKKAEALQQEPNPNNTDSSI